MKRDGLRGTGLGPLRVPWPQGWQRGILLVLPVTDGAMVTGWRIVMPGVTWTSPGAMTTAAERIWLARATPRWRGEADAVGEIVQLLSRLRGGWGRSRAADRPAWIAGLERSSDSEVAVRWKADSSEAALAGAAHHSWCVPALFHGNCAWNKWFWAAHMLPVRRSMPLRVGERVDEWCPARGADAGDGNTYRARAMLGMWMIDTARGRRLGCEWMPARRRSGRYWWYAVITGTALLAREICLSALP